MQRKKYKPEEVYDGPYALLILEKEFHELNSIIESSREMVQRTEYRLEAEKRDLALLEERAKALDDFINLQCGLSEVNIEVKIKIEEQIQKRRLELKDKEPEVLTDEEQEHKPDAGFERS